ncbi:MAG: histidine phosphotransferase family protein [Kiloniellaceae bacterium]
MDVQIDLRVAELLASRLCHDLVGPVGAVNNGLELLEDEDGADMAQDALRLAADSARRAATALQYYRFAYGMAGSRIGGDPGELRQLTANFLANNKIALEWSVPEPLADTPEDLGKLLLNLVLLGEESLPIGGTLSVAVRNGPGGLEASVAASGDHAALRDDIPPVLAHGAGPDDLTPRNVQAYFARLLARRLGAELSLDTSGSDCVRFSVAFAS